MDRGRRARRARRARRGRRRARQRSGVRAPRALPAGARPAPQHLHPPVGLHPARPAPERRLRARHPRGGHDRPDDEQRHRHRRDRLQREDHAAARARLARRRRLGRDRARHPLRGPLPRRRDQPLARVSGRGALAPRSPTWSSALHLARPARRSRRGGGRQPVRRHRRVPGAREERRSRSAPPHTTAARPTTRTAATASTCRRRAAGPMRPTRTACGTPPTATRTPSGGRSCSRRSRASHRPALRAAARLRGHVDGEPARGGDRGAPDRHASGSGRTPLRGRWRRASRRPRGPRTGRTATAPASWTPRLRSLPRSSG